MTAPATRPFERGRRRFAAILLLALTLQAAPVWAQDGSGGEWHTWGSDDFFTRYSPLDQISPDNVDDLRVAWRWPTADRELQQSNPLWRTGRNEVTPLMANGVLYTVTGLGLVAALDPASGETRWVYDPESYAGGRSGAVGFVHRSLAYWTDGAAERLLLGTIDAQLISLDARTGQPDAAFGDGGARGSARRRAARQPRRPARGGPPAAGGRRCGRRRQLHIRPGAQPGDAARRRAGIRRPYRETAMDVSDRAAGVRSRL